MFLYGCASAVLAEIYSQLYKIFPNSWVCLYLFLGFLVMAKIFNLTDSTEIVLVDSAIGKLIKNRAVIKLEYGEGSR